MDMLPVDSPINVQIVERLVLGTDEIVVRLSDRRPDAT